MNSPVLFGANSTAFTSLGIGVLSDCISCIVTEERNGEYELEMEYPITGKYYSEIALRSIVACDVGQENRQAFRIYKIEKSIDGTVVINAAHLSYDLTDYTFEPFTAKTCATALRSLTEQADVTCPFTLRTDKTTEATFAPDVPSTIRSWLGGRQGSILDVYGGEYEFDNYTVTLREKRGADNGVIIRYGKNLTDLKQEENCSSVYTAVRPFWKDSEGNLVTLSEKVIEAGGTYSFIRILPLDLSDQWGEAPTEEQLRTAAKSYMTANKIGVPSVNITLSYIDLNGLDKISLCDTVYVRFTALGVDAKAKCIKTVWNVLQGRYDSIEIGDAKSNFAAAVNDVATQIAETKEQANYTAGIARKLADGISQHFLYNDTGAYVTSEETEEGKSPTKNYMRMTSEGTEIVDNNGDIAAQFTDHGVEIFTSEETVAFFGKENGQPYAQIGNRSKAHAELDYNSFDLFNQYGKEYAHIGDLRDNNGIATITERYIKTIANQYKKPLLSFTPANYYTSTNKNVIIVEDMVVKVDGTTISQGTNESPFGGDYYVSRYDDTTATRAQGLANRFYVSISKFAIGQTATISYTTKSEVYQYLLGTNNDDTGSYAEAVTADGKYLRHLDWNGNETIYGDLFIGGHKSPVGTSGEYGVSQNGSFSKGNGTFYTGGFTLDPGIWLAVASVRMTAPASNDTYKYQELHIGFSDSTSNNILASDNDFQTSGGCAYNPTTTSGSVYVYTHVADIITVDTSKKYYLRYNYSGNSTSITFGAVYRYKYVRLM